MAGTGPLTCWPTRAKSCLGASVGSRESSNVDGREQNGRLPSRFHTSAVDAGRVCGVNNRPVRTPRTHDEQRGCSFGTHNAEPQAFTRNGKSETAESPCLSTPVEN
jgi:hypothetical protein